MQLLDSIHLDLPSKHLPPLLDSNTAFVTEIPAGIARVSGLVLASSTACTAGCSGTTANLITGSTNSCDCFYELVRASSITTIIQRACISVPLDLELFLVLLPEEASGRVPDAEWSGITLPAR